MHLLDTERVEYYEIWVTVTSKNGAVVADEPVDRFIGNGRVTQFYRDLEVVQTFAKNDEDWLRDRDVKYPVPTHLERTYACYVVAVTVTKRRAV